MRPAPLANRLNAYGKSHSAILKRTTKLVAIDVLGTALYQVVLHHDDVHRLVASTLTESSKEIAGSYVDARLEAEAIARSQAESAGRQTIGIANIADHLPILLDDREPLLKRGQLARKAVRTELELERLLCRANPKASSLIDDAKARAIPVAFVADSYLPRDLLSRMLSDADYPIDHLLVSSQEGVTQAAGHLLPLLAKRTAVPLRDIVYVGPDAPVAPDAGPAFDYSSHVLTSPRASADNLLGAYAVPRSGVGGLALALAADRLGSITAKPAPNDIGYYGAGPLAAGFAAWVGVQADELEPDHVLFTGPARLLLRRVVSIMRPDLDLGSFHVPPTEALLDQATNERWIVESAGVTDDQVVLVVDLGFSNATQRVTAQACADAGLNVEVVGAHLTTPEDPTLDHQPHRIWAPDLPGGDAVRAVFERMLSPLSRPGGQLDVIGTEIDLRAEHDMTLGVDSFAEDFEPLVCLDRSRVGPALVGPALRIINEPTRAEASTIGASMVADGTIETVWPQGFAQLRRNRPRFQRS